MASETEFAFKHLLVRDVAYGQIPRAQRGEKHRRAAEWIESLGRPEDHAEMVAHHYLSAVELARASGQDIDTLAAPAASALGEAGDRAAALNALPQAERYYREALALTSPTDPRRVELLFRQGRTRFLRHEEGAEELEVAQAGFLARGDRERAAEAALLLADISWRSGHRDRMLVHLQEARALVAGSPPSRIRASVLSQGARYEMLADQQERALVLGREALAMADELGLDDLRAHALNNIGSARAFLGDPAGFAELEESIALAAKINSITDVLRGHNNLAATYLVYGDLPRARAEEARTYELAERFGHHGFARFISGGPGIGNRYTAGQWDDALKLADAFIEEVESGGPHYQAATVHTFRGMIKLARGDTQGALIDAERGVELGRPARDPQLYQTTLAMAAVIFLSGEKPERAAQTVSEAIADLQELPSFGFAGIESHDLAWSALMLGREAEVREVLDREPIDSPWIRAARAVTKADFRLAADTLGEMGAVTPEAMFRLRYAEQLVAEGRRAEADEQLHRALAFYRSVGATRYVREGEALLAASA